MADSGRGPHYGASYDNVPGSGIPYEADWWEDEKHSAGFIGVFEDEINDVDPDAGCCESCLLGCEDVMISRMNQYDACLDHCAGLGCRCCTRRLRPTERSMQLFCVFLILIGISVSLTGRGLLSVLQGIIGMLFGVEGLTAFTTKNLKLIRRFSVLLFLFLLVTAVIGTFNLLTVDQFCRTAENDERCQEQARLNAYGVLFGGSLILILFLTTTRRWIQKFTDPVPSENTNSTEDFRNMTRRMERNRVDSKHDISNRSIRSYSNPPTKRRLPLFSLTNFRGKARRGEERLAAQSEGVNIFKRRVSSVRDSSNRASSHENHPATSPYRPGSAGSPKLKRLSRRRLRERERLATLADGEVEMTTFRGHPMVLKQRSMEASARSPTFTSPKLPSSAWGRLRNQYQPDPNEVKGSVKSGSMSVISSGPNPTRRGSDSTRGKPNKNRRSADRVRPIASKSKNKSRNGPGGHPLMRLPSVVALGRSPNGKPYAIKGGGIIRQKPHLDLPKHASRVRPPVTPTQSVISGGSTKPSSGEIEPMYAIPTLRPSVSAAAAQPGVTRGVNFKIS
ncbi:hypothetical protein AAMO2058_000643500 [Amorphochlora amoebiformis]